MRKKRSTTTLALTELEVAIEALTRAKADATPDWWLEQNGTGESYDAACTRALEKLNLQALKRRQEARERERAALQRQADRIAGRCLLHDDLGLSEDL
jgi:hypothetical protein